jgi:tetratricopeptide (TPR) repeat protein
MYLGSKWQHALLLAVLAGGTFLLYLPVLGFDFINLDDDAYITANPNIAGGLNAENVRWAFTAVHSANWHPLTWMSHQLDATLFGLHPAGHHFTNVLLHVINTLLLYALIATLTHTRLRAFFVAALFAWHPMHIESVAWVAERKDVLSTGFAWLALIAYAAYVRKPAIGRYLLVALLLAVGLMAKQMLVTLPAVMFILDFWPLQRIATIRQAFWRGVEKLPLLAVSAGAAAAAFLAQKSSGAVESLDRLPLADRLGNAVITGAQYAAKLFYPDPLAIPYPFTDDRVTAVRVAIAATVLIAITAAALLLARRAPWFLAGWAFYGITLLPVIGIIQIGSQAMADRYTYLPYTGLFIVLAWLAARLAGDVAQQVLPSIGRLPEAVLDLSTPHPPSREARATPFEGGPKSVHARAVLQARRALVAIIVALGLFACITTTRAHLPVWRDSVSLFQHSLSVTERNFIAHNNLGQALFERGQYVEAGEQFAASLQITPGNLDALNNYGAVLLLSGKPKPAAEHFRAYLEERPQDAEVRVNMAVALFQQGRLENARNQARHALKLRPGFAKAQQLLRDMAAAERRPQ